MWLFVQCRRHRRFFRMSKCLISVICLIVFVLFLVLIYSYSKTSNTSQILRIIDTTHDNVVLPKAGDKTVQHNIESVQLIYTANNFSYASHTWLCHSNKCLRVDLLKGEQQVDQDTCQMLCSLPPIWPKPRKLHVTNKNTSAISPNRMRIEISVDNDQVKSMLLNASDIFTADIQTLIKSNNSLHHHLISLLSIHFVIATSVTKLHLNTDESYELTVTKILDSVVVNVNAATYFGARYALETLSQLIWYDTIERQLKILHDVEVLDMPAFPYRGLMVDTARNYFPIFQLKRIVDGMAATKLNSLHLHLTDSFSFPVVLPRAKGLAQHGAYSSEKIYQPGELQDLVQYARLRGIRTVLEVDAPSHVYAGWRYYEAKYNEKFVLCADGRSLDGVLNPDNKHVLDVLQAIYTDLLELMDDNEIFHLGGDEVNLNCWKNLVSLNEYNDVYDLWANFQNAIINRLKAANNNKLPPNLIVWSSALTQSSEDLPKLNGNIVVQYWMGHKYVMTNNKKSIIYSTVGYWYLDCGFGPWKPDMVQGLCDPYTPWTTFYRYRPWEDDNYVDKTLGGEVCLWSEQVSVDTLETRIWPRSAAFAERVWSDPDAFNNYDVYTRLDYFSKKLSRKGIKVAAMWPEWCSQNPGQCGFH